MTILLHIPHASYSIPFEYQNLFYLNQLDLRQEQIKMTDSYTDDLFDVVNVEKLIFPISRLICDVERFRDDKEEIMYKKGMGVSYTKSSNLKPLKMVSASHKQEILEKYYDIHHKLFYEKVSSILEKDNECLIIDCHSFSSTPLSYEDNQDSNRPDICIGIDAYHTPENITNVLTMLFKRYGYSVAINSPYAGAIIPVEYYKTNKKVSSVMIEVNRSLYMNEQTTEKNLYYDKLKVDLNCIIGAIETFKTLYGIVYK